MYSFGLLGCGKIAERHANLLAKGEIKGAKLKCVFDLDLARAKAFASKYECESFGTPEQMAEAVDAISVVTPSGTHAENVVALAPFGKPFVIEKPLALTLNDADQMIEACDSSGSRMFVVKQNRFNRPVVALRQALEEGRFGRLVLGTVRVRWCRKQEYYDAAGWRGTWEHDGGVLCNQASHHIDLLEWMMGDVESVFARTSKALADIEAEDTAVVTLKFRNGALGIIEATTATRPKDLEGSLSVLGETGSVVVGGFAVNDLKTWAFSDERPSDEGVFERDGTNPKHPYGYAHKVYYEHVVECMESGKQQLVDGLAARKSLELITAIYESSETGKEVQLRFAPSKCRLGRPAN